MNNGSLLPTQLATEVNFALGETDYVNFNFSLEGPHGSVHVLVGGGGGDMSSIGRSANDPIFWLHHCNIDRLWNVWLNQSGNQNPTDPAFLDQQYSFADASGATATVKVKDFINSASLGYRYDMVPNPPPSGQPEFVAATDSRPAGGHGASTARPSVLVASSRKESTTDTPQEPVKLSFAPKSFELTLQPGGQGALESAADAIPGTGRVVVDIVGLKCKTPPSFTYGVYVNLPEGEANESTLNQRFAGTVNLFGIADSDSGEHSKLRTVDLTKVIGRLKRTSQFNPSKVTISLRPLAPVPTGGTESPDQDQAHRNSAEQAAIQFDRIDVRVVR
jgi:tyrosinase